MSHASPGISLADRVKQLSYTTGSSNYSLDASSQGFSSFGDLYSSGDVVFYAATDGTDYEVGSGIYHYKISGPDELERSTLVSTNSNLVVDWGAGIKEVFVTYPADFAVYTASGLGPYFKQPSESGIAFWETPNILNYDSKLVWESVSGFLGVSNDSPQYAIDIGGSATYSHIRASGATVSTSGVSFPSGRQTLPFFTNDLIDGDVTENTNIGAVIQLSGTVSEYIGLKKQPAGSFFAGPLSGCQPGCSPEYPSFRNITKEDIPDDIGGGYVKQNGDASKSGVPYFYESGVIAYDDNFRWNPTDNRLGINYSTVAPHALSVSGDAMVSGTLYVSDIHGLTAGSGLELGANNLTFNVGNVYNMAVASGGAESTVSQSDTVVVSGVGGISTSIFSDGTTHVVSIDPSVLSGVLSDTNTYTAGSGLELVGQKFNVMQADSVALSGDNLPSGGAIWSFGTAISGALNTKIDAVELSGASPSSGVRIVSQEVMLDDPANLVYLPSGDIDITHAGDRVLVWDTTETKWRSTRLADVSYKFGSATGGDTNEFSWKTIVVNSGDYHNGSGVFNFDGTSNISATNTLDKLNLVAGSGVILNTDVNNSGIRISASGYQAGSGLTLSENLTNRNSTFNAVSGSVSNRGIVSLSNTVPDNAADRYSSAITPYALVAVSGHLASSSYSDGRLFPDSGLYFPSGNFAKFGGPISAGGEKLFPHQGQARSVVMGRYASSDVMGNSNIDSVIIGHRASVSAGSNSGIVSIGESAGYNAQTNSKSVFIGTGAGSGVQNSTNVICIGEEAGENGNDIDGSIVIGTKARSITRNNIYIGSNAGSLLQGSGNIEIVAGTNADNEVNGLASASDNMVNIAGVITADWATRKVVIGSGHWLPTATLNILPYTRSTVGLVVSGVKSHTADLQQWNVQDLNNAQSTSLSVNHSGILVFDSPFPSSLAPPKSLFVDHANNKLTFVNSSNEATQLENINELALSYVATPVITFASHSGALGITTSLASANNKYIKCTYNSTEPTITVNVPHSDFWNPAVGTEVIFEQHAGVNVSISASGGDVIVNSAYTRTTAGQYSVISIKKVDSNTWTLTGDLQ